MKCQSCGKKEASIKYYENINGNQQEILICEECAKKFGISSFSDFFSPIFVTFPKVNEEKNYNKKCEKCGYDFNKYMKTGFLGCPKCYDSFKDKLDEILLKMHGKIRHVELSNKSNKSKDNGLSELKQKLQELIKSEEYEQAAVIRDEIKKIEGRC